MKIGKKEQDIKVEIIFFIFLVIISQLIHKLLSELVHGHNFGQGILFNLLFLF